MKKIIVVLAALCVLSGSAFAITDKIGVGVHTNLILIEEFMFIPAAEVSLRGIFSNFAVELSGSSNNISEDKTNIATVSDIGLTATYLIDFKKNIVLEMGITASQMSENDPESEDYNNHSSMIGIVLGAEYFVNDNFGINLRVIPLMSASGMCSNDDKWQNTMMGYGIVGANLYL